MRLIDTEDILVGCVKTGLKEYDTGKEAGIDLVLAIINHLPTIEAKPVVHAHWEEIANGFMVCSHCKESVEENRKYSYCPICGAQMDELVSKTDELKCSEKPNSSVKIPVISMEDVPKIMEEKE